MKELLTDTVERVIRYASSVQTRRVFPAKDAIARLEKLGGSLPDLPQNDAEVIALLDEIGSDATVTSTGPRYFGFVTGGALPVTVAANMLAAGWDQNVTLNVMSPVAAALEKIALQWLVEIFDFPQSCGAGFVTGATMANFTCLAAARSALLRRAGWNVEELGLYGAPELKVVVGKEVHVSLLKALAMLGLGKNRVTTVPADQQGRFRADAMPAVDHSTIVCMQAGNVNTGAFDPAVEICELVHKAGGWVHVDGAFGLWAAAAPARRYLMQGVKQADSWATDCHKWLNVSYDSGLAFVRNAEDLSQAMSINAPYLQTTGTREPGYYTPEASRRARGVEIWAALKSLGRSGLAELIERNCQQAQRFAQGLTEAGFQVLNDVVLNQVLVSFGDAERTRQVIAAVQEDGTCWCGGTQWQGHAAMRISVSSWATTESDVDLSVAAITRIARAIGCN